MSKRRRLGLTFALALLLSLSAALISSKLYWGYYCSRPGLDLGISNARRYLSVTTFTSAPAAGTATRLLPAKRDLSRLLHLADEAPYDFADYAILGRLEQEGVLESLPPMETSRLDALLPLMRSSGELVTPQPGYQAGQYLVGLAVEAEDAEGVPLLYLAAKGGQVSNDHYPHYQLLFRGSEPDRRLVHSTLFFADVAGIEGFEWPWMAFAYLLVVFPLLVGLRDMLLMKRSRSRLI